MTIRYGHPTEQKLGHETMTVVNAVNYGATPRHPHGVRLGRAQAFWLAPHLCREYQTWAEIHTWDGRDLETRPAVLPTLLASWRWNAAEGRAVLDTAHAQVTGAHGHSARNTEER